jgi:hypothetical protein
MVHSLVLETLRNDIVSLRPFDSENDFEYLIELTQKYRYNKTSILEARRLLDEYGRYFWMGYVDDGVRAGVGYVCYFPKGNIWTFDAYRDEELIKKYNHKLNYTLEAGKLLLPWILNNITPVIYTSHEVKNKAATKVCKMLGFKEVWTKEILGDKFIFMERRK